MPQLRLPDGTTVALPEGEPIGGALEPSAIAALVDGELRDLSFVPAGDVTVEPWTFGRTTGFTYCGTRPHTCSPRPSAAWPGAKFAIGPAIADGFYYDLEIPNPLLGRRPPRVEETMREIVAEDQPFVREEVDRDEALRRLADQPYKIEIIEGLGADEASATSRLARRPPALPQRRLGGSLPRPARAVDRQARRVQAHRGRRRVLARRREAPEAPADLRHRVGDEQGRSRSTCTALEEAERRDHRKLGVELDLFSFPDEIGSGLAVFHPKGGTVRMSWRTTRASATRRRATSSSTRRTSRSRELFEIAGTSTGSPTACSRRWSSTAARSTTSSR